MSQQDTFITIGKSFEEAERYIETIAEEKGMAEVAQNIIYELKKAQIIETCIRNFEKTGKILPGGLKKSLSEKHYISEKYIEEIVYIYFRKHINSE